jgi:hypothetical protein
MTHAEQIEIIKMILERIEEQDPDKNHARIIDVLPGEQSALRFALADWLEVHEEMESI